MQTKLTRDEWYAARFENYMAKLQITKRKAQKRLMLSGNIHREFNRICDNKYWTNKEPGISWEERKKRTAEIFKLPAPKTKQLSLFKKSEL